jgi:hypothetical protein
MVDLAHTTTKAEISNQMEDEAKRRNWTFSTMFSFIQSKMHWGSLN